MARNRFQPDWRKWWDLPGVWQIAGVAIVGFCIGLILTNNGTHFWDDMLRYRHSLNILEAYGLASNVPATLTSYGALWEFFLGIQTDLLFPFLRAPYWLRHSWDVSLYITLLYTTYALLRRAGQPVARSVFAVVAVFGIIRLGGHALFNPKDTPAAMVYLVVSIGVWLLFQQLRTRVTWQRLTALGIVAILPFLIRVPLLLHAVVTFAILVLIALTDRRLSAADRVRLVALPLLSGALALVLFHPILWSNGVHELVSATEEFRSFNWSSDIRAFGQTIATDNLPWWYALIWPVIIIQPVVFVVVLIGLTNWLWTLPQAWRRWRPALLQPPLAVWLAGLGIASYVCLLLLHPALYEEDRQILFLYPLLVVTAVLSWPALRPRWQWGLIGVCLIASLWSYGRWQVYSYVYRSPLTATLPETSFLGDYYALCLNQGVRRLPEYLPADTMLHSFPVQIASLQNLQLTYRRFMGQPFPHYIIVRDQPSQPPYAALTAHRSDRTVDEAVMSDVAAGRAQLLWSDTLPTGEIACSLVFYP